MTINLTPNDKTWSYESVLFLIQLTYWWKNSEKNIGDLWIWLTVQNLRHRSSLFTRPWCITKLSFLNHLYNQVGIQNIKWEYFWIENSVLFYFWSVWFWRHCATKSINFILLNCMKHQLCSSISPELNKSKIKQNRILVVNRMNI